MKFWVTLFFNKTQNYKSVSKRFSFPTYENNGVIKRNDVYKIVKSIPTEERKLWAWE